MRLCRYPAGSADRDRSPPGFLSGLLLRLATLTVLAALAALAALAPCAITADEEPVAPAGAHAAMADAKAAFAKQAKTFTQPTGTGPGIIGVYLWSGRADENYRGFFQWEFRLKGGSASLSGLRARVTTLSYERKPLVTGPWVNLPALPAGATHEVSYRCNCATFPAYQVDLSWQGGAQSYLAWDRFIQPINLGELEGTSMLISLNQTLAYQPERRTAVANWIVWNIGGASAHQVVWTLHLRDESGKEVGKATCSPKHGDIAAGAVLDQTQTVPRSPPCTELMVSTVQADSASSSSSTLTIDPGVFTSAKDVEVAEVHVVGNQLHARVRNGTEKDLHGLVVTLSLLDGDGKTVKEFAVTIGDLAASKLADFSVDLTGVSAWSSYAVGWRSA